MAAGLFTVRNGTLDGITPTSLVKAAKQIIPSAAKRSYRPRSSEICLRNALSLGDGAIRRRTGFPLSEERVTVPPSAATPEKAGAALMSDDPFFSGVVARTEEAASISTIPAVARLGIGVVIRNDGKRGTVQTVMSSASLTETCLSMDSTCLSVNFWISFSERSSSSSVIFPSF